MLALIGSALALPPVGSPRWERIAERGMYFSFEPYAATPPVSAAEVTDIHVVFSNHLDAGFNVRAWCMHDPANDGCTSTAPSKQNKLPCRPWTYWVVQENLDTFIPRAIGMAEELRNSSTPFQYLTNAWLVSFLLDCEKSGLAGWGGPTVAGEPLLKCPSPSAIEAFKTAAKQRDVHWHAFPFSSNPGLYDADLLSASLKMAADLAADLGVRKPTTFSQRDETGMSRSIVPLLTAAGVGMISLGSGGASGGHPAIPDLFVWRDPPSGEQVLFAFDHGYGGGTHILPNGVALYCAWNTDNGGPMSAKSVASIYAGLQKRYPKARVHASTFDDFYDAASEVLDRLPVVTQEIGDTWLYGDPSDPLKNTHFREMSRIRSACVAAGGCAVDSATMKRFDRLMTKIPEHTWGEDTTWYLGDNVNWTNVQLRAALPQQNYQLSVNSWLEQRSYLANAVAVLSASDDGAPYRQLASTIERSLAALAPSRPTNATLRAAGLRPLPTASSAAQSFSCEGIAIGFGADGSVTTLAGSQAWASAESPLGRYTYQSLSPEDFDAFDHDYGFPQCGPESEDPGCHNFDKPNMSSARASMTLAHLEVSPRLSQLWYKPSAARATRDGVRGSAIEACSFAVEALVPTSVPCNASLPSAPHHVGRTCDVHADYGAPDTIWLALEVRPASSEPGGARSFAATFDVQLFNKTATRLAEASWVSFEPPVRDSAHGWRVDPYNGSQVDPTDVVAHGATHLHSVGPHGKVVYTGREGSLAVAPLDAPIVSMGLLSPFPTPGDNTSLPSLMAGGVHVNVQNNIWNTNYPQWYPFVRDDADARYRFELAVVEARREQK